MKCAGEDLFEGGENMYKNAVIAGGFEELKDLKAEVSRRYDMILKKARTYIGLKEFERLTAREAKSHHRLLKTQS